MMGDLRRGEYIHMDFTINEKGRFEGVFEVENRAHVYDDSTGYKQRIQITPVDV
jgi:hypothetical protein